MYYESSITLKAEPKEIFAYINDHKNFSSHMTKTSWMMGGGSMKVTTDGGNGQRIGSHIRLNGKAFGINLYLDEVITKYNPPHIKSWETIGEPKLLVIGSYKMGIEIKEEENGSNVSVFIDYRLPKTNTWLGILFSKMYAKWCVHQVVNGVDKHFIKEDSS